MSFNAAAWGDNVSGQSAAGFRGAQQKTPVASVAFGAVDQIDSQYGASYAVNPKKELLVVGANQYGEYGDGTQTTARTLPGIVPGLSVRQVAAGGAHWVALTVDGGAATCGGNAYGELGIGTSGKGQEAEGARSPVHPAFARELIAVAAGGSNCAAIDNDDELLMWGANLRGQIGDGTKLEKPLPTPVLSNVKQIALGGSGAEGHALALLHDGRVMAWGLNNHGQLGDGTISDKHSPTVINLPTTVVALSASNSHSLALLSDGTVLGWGNNNVGALGQALVPMATTPEQVPLPGPATAIAAGFRYSLFLIGEQVYACGSNHYSTLGAGEPVEQRATPMVVPDLSGVQAIVAGDFQAMVLETGLAPYPPIVCEPISGGLRVTWMKDMAKKLVYRPVAPGHQEWEGHLDVGLETSRDIMLPTGKPYEVGVTGGDLGELVSEGVPL